MTTWTNDNKASSTFANDAKASSTFTNEDKNSLTDELIDDEEEDPEILAKLIEWDNQNKS